MKLEFISKINHLISMMGS